MAKTLTIQLPDNLQEHLGLPASGAEESLETVILQALKTLANAIQNLQDPDSAVRVKVAQTLGMLGTETTIPALATLLQDSNLSVRQAAIEALQQIGSESALTTLTRERPKPSTIDPIAALIGTLHLGTTDLAENHDRYLATELTLQK